LVYDEYRTIPSNRSDETMIPPEVLEQYNSGKGESLVTAPKPDIVLMKVIGHLDKVMGRRTLDIVDKLVPQHRVFYLFCDWAEMNGYDSEIRNMYTQWVASNRSRLKVHILVSSKLVSMGVSVANLALGGSLIGYTNRPAFEAALRSTRMGLGGLK